MSREKAKGVVLGLAIGVGDGIGATTETWFIVP